MLITEENIDEIRSWVKQLMEFCDFDYDDFDWDDYIQVGTDYVSFSFPGDSDTVEVDVSTLCNIVTNLKNYQEEGKSTVRCGKLSQTVISIENTYDTNAIFDEEYVAENFSAQIVESPILIGMRNLKHGCFDFDLWSPCQAYHAVEFTYADGKEPLSFEDEQKELQRFLFMLSVKYNCAIVVDELPTQESVPYTEEDVDPDSLDDQEDAPMIVSSSDNLPAYSPMLRLYIEAQTIKNSELRYLLFYKIIEFVSPLIAKGTAYKQLAAKLDMQVFEKRNYTYYNDLLSIAKKFDDDQRDSELAATVLVECCDFCGLADYLPESVISLVKRNCGFYQEWKREKLTSAELNKLNRTLASCLYSTRNSIVHAKSNFIPIGKECPSVDLDQLNEFMQRLCYAIIMWNNRQPEEMRMS